MALTAGAEVLNLRHGAVTYQIPVEKAGDMTFAAGGTLSLMGRTFNLAELSGFDIDDSEPEANTVKIVYGASGAQVSMHGELLPYVEATVSGNHVTITQSEQVSETTCGEITYQLSGEATDGSFTMTGSYKSSIELLGVNLTNPTGAALNIQNGKRTSLSIKNGTTNALTDGEGSQKGAIVCTGHLELKGKGALTVKGVKSHAIYAKEYVTLKNATVTVLGAKKDGINCTQYFAMESGTLNISGTGDDGIQVDYKDSADREEEDTGSITFSGGTANVDVTATAAKAFKAEGPVFVTGGDVTAAVHGGGLWDSSKNKTKAASCFSSDENMTISGGSLDLTATGGGGKGISVDGTLTVTGGEVVIHTSGGVYAYVNGTEYQNYTGNTDYLASDQKSSPKGIKVDGEILINGGNLNVTTTGRGAEGIESKSTLTINDGQVKVRAYDDGINSSSHMYLNGGEVEVMSTNNDGLDSNGSIYMAGGHVSAFGGKSPECGLDANSEQGYTVYFTGGSLLACGGGNSLPTTTASTQPYLSVSLTIKAGDTFQVKDGTNVLATFIIPEGYSSTSSGGGTWGGGRPGGQGGGTAVTCPGLVSGQTYTVTCGTSSTTATATLRSSGGR